jgi:hypothetical protein
LQKRERVLKARIFSTNVNGGEVVLENPELAGATDPFEQLAAGQWIMLCGPHPSSSDVEPRFALNWYKVMAVDSEGTGISGFGFDPRIHRLVTLRGPEWPWLPTQSAGDVSNNLCVGLFPGAVAVHTKTLRLPGKSSAASGGAVGPGGPTSGLY